MTVSGHFAGVSLRAFRAALFMGVALPVAMVSTIDGASAQSSDLGSVTVAAAPKPAATRKPKQKPHATRAV